MIYISSPSISPYFNLALEQYVFDEMPKNQEYLMLWQNNNTIVVGKYQNTAEEINSAYVAANGINVVRRLSGGGAVYHDMGNLNFTFIMNAGAIQRFDFHHFTLPVINTLAGMGIKAEFNSRNDITIADKKFSGNAQYLRQGRVMHHGTLLFDSDLSVLQAALNVQPDKYESKGKKSIRSRVCNINEHLQSHMSIDEFKNRLIAEITRETELSEHILTQKDIGRAQEISSLRYETWEWNYGRSPDFNVKKNRRFEGGSLLLMMNVVKGHIEEACIYGDFFGNDGVRHIEQALAGVELNETSISAALYNLPINDYINGLNIATLIEFLLT